MTREELINLLDDNGVAFEVVKQVGDVLTVKVEVQAEEPAELEDCDD
jgi:hypothetical protein